MWRTYIPESQGVAIVTSFAALTSALDSFEPDVHAGRVEYLDYQTERLARVTPFGVVMHKRREYEAEREVRAIALDESPYPDRALRPLRKFLPDDTEVDQGATRIESPPWQSKAGLEVRVDVNLLFQKVRVAPGAGEWQRLAVESLLRRYGVTCPVELSSLDDLPLR